MEVVNQLISLGVLTPAPPKVPDNTKAYEAARRRKDLKQNAKELGEAPPIFQRGRPRKYFTVEDKRAANSMYKQRSKEKVKELMRQAVENLTARSVDPN